MSDAVLQVSQLNVQFGAHAVLHEVSFDVREGESVGLVGESGSGKSTLARAILRLVHCASGRVEWRGEDLLSSPPAVMRAKRRELQIVFQDPKASLNPRMSVGAAVGEPLKIFSPDLNATEAGRLVDAMLLRVGLDASMTRRYPHEFSGGQCQRIAIARAMMLNPRLLICDEAVSSLDVSIQGQIINLLQDLQRENGMAMLFISHNLAVVRHLCHRVLVMFMGRLVEIADRGALFDAPVHPYTRALLAAAAFSGAPEPAAEANAGERGCAYRHRCRHALPLCAASAPALREVQPGVQVACHRALEPGFRYS